MEASAAEPMDAAANPAMATAMNGVVDHGPPTDDAPGISAGAVVLHLPPVAPGIQHSFDATVCEDAERAGLIFVT